MTEIPLDLIENVIEEPTGTFSELLKVAKINPTHELRGADLRNIDFEGCDLSGFDFSRADLRGADFSHANFVGAKFTGADLRDCKWPDSFELLIAEYCLSRFKESKNKYDYLERIKLSCNNNTHDYFELIGNKKKKEGNQDYEGLFFHKNNEGFYSLSELFNSIKNIDTSNDSMRHKMKEIYKFGVRNNMNLVATKLDDGLQYSIDWLNIINSNQIFEFWTNDQKEHPIFTIHDLQKDSGDALISDTDRFYNILLSWTLGEMDGVES
ncbi:pentapeptide repeat-containing protein [Hyphobacterium sp.]|uniref:pentapeptide repeat-containing protein n=1 Tax=Hyphobacterium sp. TaxID=2004662 RepID=UPI0037484DA1